MIPNLFRRRVGEGSLTVPFVPVFTGCLQRSREEARRVFDATWTLAAVVGLAITVCGIVWAEPLIRLFAPGFALEPGKLALAVELLRLCFPYILMLSLVAVAMGALNVLGHFFAPAIAPVFLNLCLISAAVSGGLAFDPPVLALGWAVLAAGIIQVLIQLPPLRRRGFAPRPRPAPGHPAIRRLGVLMLPAALGASVFQINVLVSRFLASFLGDGAVSYLYYADRLLELPLGVFVFAIGTASLPSFARLAKAGRTDALRDTFSSTLRLALALALPSTLGLALLREEIFSSLFAWNPALFGAEAVRGCGRALLFYSLGLVPITATRIYVGLAFAHERPRLPLYAACVAVAVNAVASLALVGPLPAGGLPGPLIALQHALVVADLGYAGLALAASIASAANCACLVVAVHWRWGPFYRRRDAGHLARLVLASAALAVAVLTVGAVLPGGTGSGASVLGLLRLALLVAVGAGTYALALAALGSPEWGALRALLPGGGPGPESP
jgi:putative peptidoglycan lipid II flippase